jgi:hypothetical protein
VLLVLPGDLTPAIILVFHLVGDGRARGVFVAGNGPDAAEVVVGGADAADGVIDNAARRRV